MSGKTSIAAGLACGAVMILAAAHAAAEPEGGAADTFWNPVFHPPGVSGSVSSLAFSPSGDLYVGGNFSFAGGGPAQYLAAWNGTTWFARGDSSLMVTLGVEAVAVDDDGNAFGALALPSVGPPSGSEIFSWNGSEWVNALPRSEVGWILDLAFHPGGDLYAAGAFLGFPGTQADRIARWDGAAWHPLGDGLGSESGDFVSSIVFDHAGHVFAGGIFSESGTKKVFGVAEWDGAAWSDLDMGVSGIVHALAFDTAGNLYAGGNFAVTNDNAITYLARWDGTAWSSPGAVGNTVYALLDDGSGGIYAAGAFTMAGGQAANGVAHWDGVTWQALGEGVADVESGREISTMVLSPGGDLYAGGDFIEIGGVKANRLARWDGEAWHALGLGLEGEVLNCLLALPDGPVLAGGALTHGAGVPVSGLAAWDGTAWSDLNVGGVVHALEAGPGVVYAGGLFTTAGGAPASRIAQWDGAGWTALGSGVTNTSFVGPPVAVNALAYHASGLLYAGGAFNDAGGSPAANVAVWNGAAWSALGAGLGPQFSSVDALAVNGAGMVYAGGTFTESGGETVEYLAQWDGALWTTVGAGVDGPVYALAIDGNGGLYAGGAFAAPASNLARWDGAAWSPVGGGVNGPVYALERLESGALLVTGEFTEAGGVPANGAAIWNGAAWHALGSGFTGGSVRAAAVRRNALFLGGDFTDAGGKPSPLFAHWKPRIDWNEGLLEPALEDKTLAASPLGYFIPSLEWFEDTAVAKGGPAPMIRIDRAPEVHVNGVRVEGAFAFEPQDIALGGAGATLTIEFSEDDAEAFGVPYTEFVPVRLEYAANYPASLEAASATPIGEQAPVFVRNEGERKIYAIDVIIDRLGFAYGAVPASAAEPMVAADVNRDGAVNAVDLQLVINAALGLAIHPAYNADVNRNASVNAVDIQLVINAALGIP